jgi:hypothetical protein
MTTQPTPGFSVKKFDQKVSAAIPTITTLRIFIDDISVLVQMGTKTSISTRLFGVPPSERFPDVDLYAHRRRSKELNCPADIFVRPKSGRRKVYPPHGGFTHDVAGSTQEETMTAGTEGKRSDCKSSVDIFYGGTHRC